MKRKKRKQKLQNFLNEFKPIIETHKDELPTFNLNKKYKQINYDNNSWFHSSEQQSHNMTKCKVIKMDKLQKNNFKCIQVKMILSDIHKEVLQNWFKASTLMYNKTLEYIRNNFTFTKKEVTKTILNNNLNNPNFFNKRYIRTKMNKERIQIQKSFKFTIDKQYTHNNKDIPCQIDAHTLDKTIFQLIENIESAKTNLLRNNIKRFRLKFWKFTRPKQVLNLEKIKITNGILCKSIFEYLPKIKYIYNSKNYDISSVKHDFKISYNKILDEYLLLIPVEVKTENNPNRNKLIVLDPGVRTFMTGLSDTKMFKVGTNVNNELQKLVKRLNKIKINPNIPVKIKKKNKLNINKKIHNLTNELHWKVIRFLTSTYKNIFLGDMSAKSIVSKNSRCLSNYSKVACLQTRYYEFSKRLEYKCSITNSKFKIVDEFYTSKTCSLCGSYNKVLEGNKIYDCINCKNKIDRDINGCRNIYLKQYISE